ncbi:bifunctional nuclease family protein [Chitinispirillales bacterium ANBcel5]|uniref:bifunctional nuclease family protein n=1 Tax=Cellulosispirillum alkaliphilum TaxID=3039283 RepID=UPI002A52AB2C|nr:bifunctional nuclease family protein [Chitinispirillales bacterium ANBcel5]
MLVQVEIASFAVDPGKNSPLILLKESGGARSIAVPIGPLEASAIAMQSLQVESQKPLTIDLVKIVIEQLGATLSRVVVYDFSEQVFLARLQVLTEKSVKFIECRPCDAISLALRCKCPIFVADSVFTKTQSGSSLSDADNLKKHISSLDTLEFGRYVLE